MGGPVVKTPHRPTLPHHDSRAGRAAPLPHRPTCPTTYIGGGSGGGAGTLLMLAEKVRHLSPSHRDPERFHMDKSEIERDLRRLAGRIGRG